MQVNDPQQRVCSEQNNLCFDNICAFVTISRSGDTSHWNTGQPHTPVMQYKTAHMQSRTQVSTNNKLVERGRAQSSLAYKFLASERWVCYIAVVPNGWPFFSFIQNIHYSCWIAEILTTGMYWSLPYRKILLSKKNIVIHGWKTTTIFSSRDNNVITATLGFCPRLLRRTDGV